MTRAEDLEIVDCPVCGPSDTNLFLEDGQPTRYVRCATCGTVYASPRAPRSKRYVWLDNTFSVNIEMFQMMIPRLPALRLEADEIQKYIPRGKILDIGCGIGDFFQFFPLTHWERHGVELSPSAAAYAAKKYACDVKVGTLREAAYRNDDFDLVSLIDTLYYLDDPAAEFREIYRVLKPGGFVGVEVAGQAYMLRRNYGLIPRLLDHRRTRASTDSSYIYWFNPTGLRLLLEKTGFKVVAWRVAPSPRKVNPLLQMLVQSHYSLASLAAKLSYRSLTWAPKYFLVAEKI